MAFNHTSIRTLAVLVCVVAGCTGDDLSQDDQSPESKAVDDAWLAPYVGCDESVADQVLVLSVTVPDVLDGYEFRIPFCQAERDGTHYGGGGSSFIATGPDGGLNGFIGIESSSTTSLSIRVDLRWTSSLTKGELLETVDVPIGNPGGKDLSEGRKIQWRFEAPRQEDHE